MLKNWFTTIPVSNSQWSGCNSYLRAHLCWSQNKLSTKQMEQAVVSVSSLSWSAFSMSRICEGQNSGNSIHPSYPCIFEGKKNHSWVKDRKLIQTFVTEQMSWHHYSSSFLLCANIHDPELCLPKLSCSLSFEVLPPHHNGNGTGAGTDTGNQNFFLRTVPCFHQFDM